MATIFRPCCWCQKMMPTERASKKLCSNECHSRFHHWRRSRHPGASVSYAFELLAEERTALLEATDIN